MTLKEVYEKHKSADALISQVPEIYKGKPGHEGSYARSMMLKECWEAIKEALGVEEMKKQ